MGGMGFCIIIVPREANALQEKWQKRGRTLDLICANLSDKDQVTEIFGEIFTKWHVDCVINSASVFDHDTPNSMDEKIFETAIAVNLKAPTRIAELYHHAFIYQDKPGCVINILDNKLYSINPDHYSYTMAKSALMAATQMMAMAYAPKFGYVVWPRHDISHGRSKRGRFYQSARPQPLSLCNPRK